MINWDSYFINIAEQVSARASCPRLSVGAIIIKDKNISSTGYNGASSGEPTCLEVGCDIQDNHCVRVIHGEVNALLFAAKHGHAIKGATMYLTHSPCWECSKKICNAGIIEVVYKNEYRLNSNIIDFFNRRHIILRKV